MACVRCVQCVSERVVCRRRVVGVLSGGVADRLAGWSRGCLAEWLDGWAADTAWLSVGVAAQRIGQLYYLFPFLSLYAGLPAGS